MHSNSPLIQLLDCLGGLDYAMNLNWFCYKKFNLLEYEHYERVENGDLNWIIPGKFVAFSSPTEKSKDRFGVHVLKYRIVNSRLLTMCPSSIR